MDSKKGQSGDDRFQKVKRDPRFWEMPEKEHIIKIDKRFQSMFHDDRVKLKYTVDKRGRPINHTSSEDLKRFYNLSDSEEEKEDGKDKEKKKKTQAKLDTGEREDKVVDEPQKPLKKGKDSQSIKSGPKGDQPIRGVRLCEEDDEEEDDKVHHIEGDDVDQAASISDGSEDDEDDDEDEADVESDMESGSEDESGSELDEDSDGSWPDLARGKGNVETSSDEDEDNDVEAILKGEEEEIQHDWGELCKDAPRSEEVTQRLAVCNMDWDRMKAKDLLALFNSFKPKGGVVLSVKIYPSEFGKERTQRRRKLVCVYCRIYREKMRDYQFKRLKYYYAVVECESLDTAAKIYQECDSFEYESSCSILDLRFIPDDVTFDEEPKDLATDVDLSAYTPKLFTSTASSHVELTWDETDHERVTAMNRKFNKDELLQMDFNAYLASSSDDDDEDGVEMEKEEELPEVKQPEEASKEVEKEARKGKQSSGKQIEKYREMPKSIQEKDKKKEDKGMEMEITWVPGLKETTEQLVKKKLEGKDKLTPWEEFIEKKKDKKKQKMTKGKHESDDSDLSDDALPPDVDFDDPFFAEELGSTGDKLIKMNPQAEMALLMDDDKHKHFNYDKIVDKQNLSKKKRKKLLKKDNTSLEEDDFQVDVKDPRFQAMFTSHLYNLDLSDRATRRPRPPRASRSRSSASGRSASATRTRRSGAKKQLPVAEATKKMDPGLSMLIKSIKNKTEQFQARKKQKTM
uniref:ESF1 RRM domain-containing protein n=1 Tax=Oncorhynchus tshawytscha TaxID=74940 RepID=A0A8C8LVH3_ONCTS